MKQPIKVGELYEDCSYKLAVVREIYPWIVNWRQALWYRLTRRAEHWDVIGNYLYPNKPGDFSNCSWNHCACIRLANSEKTHDHSN
jgi:hypothetical protein